MRDLTKIDLPKIPRTGGRTPFGLSALPVEAVATWLVWLEREALRVLSRRPKADRQFRRTLALSRAMVRLETWLGRACTWNRMAARKRTAMATEAGRAEVLAALGGEAAAERWERRAAGLGKAREARPDWYWDFKARERAEAAIVFDPISGSVPSHVQGASSDMTGVLGEQARPMEAPGQARGQLGDRVRFRWAALPRAGKRLSVARGYRIAERRLPNEMPIPVWPCEVVKAKAYADMESRVADAVAAHAAQLAAVRKADATKRARPDARDAGQYRPSPSGSRFAAGRAAFHRDNQPLYAARHGHDHHP